MRLFEKGTLEADASDNQSLSQATALQKSKQNKTTVKVYPTPGNNLQEVIFPWANPGLIPYRHRLILHIAKQGLQEMQELAGAELKTGLCYA